MATATQANPTATDNNQPNVTVETTDYVVGLETGADGKQEPAIFNATDKRFAKLVEDGKFSESFRQTVGFPVPRNVAGLAEIFTSDDSLLRAARIGIKNFGLSKLRSALLEQEEDKFVFVPVDGVYQINELLNAEPGRVMLTQREKVERDLRKAGLPDAVIATMLASYDNQAAQTE